MTSSTPTPMGAEKRALWEVRQRYAIPPQTRAATRVSGAKPATTPSATARTPQQSGGGQNFRWLKRTVLIVLFLVVLGAGIGSVKLLAAGNKISTTDRSILGQVKDLFFAQGKDLAGGNDDRINILLLAIGGQGHSGENLADTVMVASLKPSTNSVALMSIPRDLYVEVPGEKYFTKINAVHAYGENKKAGEGPILLKEKVEEITGQPIHYYTRIDFEAFKQIIEAVNGVDITIENSFFDFWHKITFSAGRETMNGERALAYVRARYVEGPEGGDFKRAARQQQVLLALKDKVFSVNTAFDFTKLNAILDSLANNIRTDMELWEMKRLYEMARTVDHDHVNSVVLTTGPKGVLVGSTELLGGEPASILKPRVGNFSEIQALAEHIFESNEHMAAASDVPVESVSPLSEASPSPASSPQATAAAASLPTIEIRNGTTITGLAKGFSDSLTAKKYQVLRIGNAATQANATTTMYTLTSVGEAGANSVQKTVRGAISAGQPDGETKSDADILLILGSDAKL